MVTATKVVGEHSHPHLRPPGQIPGTPCDASLEHGPEGLALVPPPQKSIERPGNCGWWLTAVPLVTYVRLKEQPDKQYDTTRWVALALSVRGRSPRHLRSPTSECIQHAGCPVVTISAQDHLPESVSGTAGFDPTHMRGSGQVSRSGLNGSTRTRWWSQTVSSDGP